MGLGIRTTMLRRREAAAFAAGPTGTGRVRMLRRFGWSGLGECWIEPDCVFEGPLESRPMLKIADNAYINRGTVIATHGGVSVGRHVYIGHGVTILSVTHDFGGHAQRAGTLACAPVTIGDGAWIGAGVIVLPGIDIGPGAVIGAGAVVTHDCEPDCLYTGVPAELRRRLDA